MTDKKQPEDLADDTLDDAQGGLIINLSVGVKDDDTHSNSRGPLTGKDLSDGQFNTTAGGSPNV